MHCPACGGDTPDAKRYCANCGTSLVALCASCGAALLAGKSFCADCGTPVAAQPSVPTPVEGSQAPAGRGPTELRLVSVLFCDLVGFTPLSEASDPEEVRELLSGYFDLARAIVARYGGVVEKFIGDAIMAVWGAPVANEDDAERAVRAGLDLAAAVAAYGAEYASGGLEARVGIVTGTVATTETPEEGLVVGDRVNTAARIQAAAPPGRCYVDESTRRATEAAIVYADAGSRELKGKSEPVRLYEAVRVIAGVGGALKSEGLEAPFVGRDRELRLVKDLFHASAEESRAHLVSVTGIAGIGKSRLGWEYYKYLDGLSSVYLWHRGRCLSYGEGVAHWALAEMVRGRAGILEGEDSAAAAAKLRAAVAEHVADLEERQWVEPRLAHLIGLEDGWLASKEDLFAAWRLFFERMSEGHPVVMSFEDMQWADASLLDFHRVPARLVAQPRHLRAHPRPPRARRAPPELGGGPAQLHVDLPRAARREGDARPHHRARAGLAGGDERADPRPRRGRAPLRGRDGPHAHRPRTARARRLQLPAGRRHRRPRHPRDAARSHRARLDGLAPAGTSPRPLSSASPSAGHRCSPSPTSVPTRSTSCWGPS